MADDEIDRAVAEERGWTKCDCGDPDCPYWTDKNGSDWFNEVCTDPAAWGALLEELARKGYTPRLVCETESGDFYSAYLYDKTARAIGFGQASSPGRALALAFLRSLNYQTRG